jgi:ribose 5-phosphate isomerase B
MKIAVSTDHAGFERAQHLVQVLQSLGHECVDFRPTTFNPDDDYPAEAVASGEAELGIIFGSSGQGEAMAANRVPGVRCAVYYGPSKSGVSVDVAGHQAQDEFEIIRLTKQHNNANMLSLAGRFLSDDDITVAVRLWIDTPFSNEERHARRIKKLG